MRRIRISISGLMAVVLIVSIGVAALRSASEEWAALVTLVTLWLLTFAILGAIYRRGDRRAFWTGFALFGWGYMLWASGFWWAENDQRPQMFTTMFLERIYDGVRPADIGPQPSLFEPAMRVLGSRDALIWDALERPIPMRFPTPTPLEKVIDYINEAVRSPELPDGIPIDFDQGGLQDVEPTGNTTVTLEMVDVPLRISLQHLLKQLDLTYVIKDGLLTLTYIGSAENREPKLSFLRIGHSLFGLLAGLLGSLAGRRFHATRDREPASTPCP
jgi:hypothetical protein